MVRWKVHGIRRCALFFFVCLFVCRLFQADFFWGQEITEHVWGHRFCDMCLCKCILYLPIWYKWYCTLQMYINIMLIYICKVHVPVVNTDPDFLVSYIFILQVITRFLYYNPLELSVVDRSSVPRPPAGNLTHVSRTFHGPRFKTLRSSTLPDPRDPITLSDDDWGVQSPKRNARYLGSMKPFSVSVSQDA